MPAFDAREYWDNRLREHWTVTGTGHLEYGPGYNRWLYRGKQRALRRALRPLTAGSALDVGSGTGWALRQLSRGGWSVRGCDIAAVAVARLREELPGIPVSVLDAGVEALPAADAEVTLVTAMDVAYHVVDDARFAHLVAEVARVLPPGGRVIVSDTFGATDVVPAEHVRFRSLASWTALAEPAGLTVDRLLPYFRLLSRPPSASRLRRLPGGVRGAIEYTADGLLPLRPWMRLGVLRRR